MVPVDPVEVVDSLRLINEFSDRARHEAGEQNDPYRDLPGGEGLGLGDAIEAANLIHRAAANPDRIGALNDLADRSSLTMRLGADGALGWWHDGTGPALARFLAPVLSFIDRTGIDRMGVCQARACVDLFADRSQAGDRRYCCQRCATRSRVTAWRQRTTAT